MRLLLIALATLSLAAGCSEKDNSDTAAITKGHRDNAVASDLRAIDQGGSAAYRQEEVDANFRAILARSYADLPADAVPLIKTETANDLLCFFGSGDKDHDREVCSFRSVAASMLQAHGWCKREGEAIGSARRWMKCPGRPVIKFEAAASAWGPVSGDAERDPTDEPIEPDNASAELPIDNS